MRRPKDRLEENLRDFLLLLFFFGLMNRVDKQPCVVLVLESPRGKYPSESLWSSTTIVAMIYSLTRTVRLREYKKYITASFEG